MNCQAGDVHHMEANMHVKEDGWLLLARHFAALAPRPSCSGRACNPKAYHLLQLL